MMTRLFHTCCRIAALRTHEHTNAPSGSQRLRHSRSHFYSSGLLLAMILCGCLSARAGVIYTFEDLPDAYLALSRNSTGPAF